MNAGNLRDEHGFTLIELMISMALLSIIIVPIGSSFLLGLLETTSTRDRTADSTSAQLISAYLLSDVQSSKTVRKSAGSAPCVQAPLTASGVLLELAWSDPQTSAATTVSYIDHANGSQHELHRVECSGSTIKTTLLAHYLDTTNGFVVTCDGSPTCPSTPSVVAVHVKAKSLSPQTQSSYTPFEFDFRATRRAGL